MSTTKIINLYKVVLLNGETAFLKNSSGDRVEKILEKGYVRSCELYIRCDRKELKTLRVDYDIDKVRSIRDIHALLVTELYA